MSTIRIIAGEFRGRKIPFSNKRFRNADITPQKVKGALFSILGENLHGRSFLDLYAGSGQIGIEAKSRGADPVIINETDIKRYDFIKSYIKQLNMQTPPVLLKFSAYKTIKYLGDEGIKLDIIYLDPPYNKLNGEIKKYNELLGGIEKNSILNEEGKIIIQHFKENLLNDTAGTLKIINTKSFGSTVLTIYGKY